MVTLGVDYGEKRIGLALAEGSLASPVVTVSSLAEVTRFAVENKARQIVVGLPLDAEGREGFQAKKVRSFGERLTKETKLPICYWDETLSTQDALGVMIESGTSRKRRRQKLDAVAAAIVLQEYLDHPPAPNEEKGN